MKAGTMTYFPPLVLGKRARHFNFDLTVAPLDEDRAIIPLAWNTNDTRWEIVVDSTGVHVQWLPIAVYAMWPTALGERATGVEIDDGELHHIRVGTKPVSLTVDGTRVVTVVGAPPGRPVMRVDLDRHRVLTIPADDDYYPRHRRLYPELGFPELTTDPGSESGSWDPVDPWPTAMLG
jgi:hypothetical protein